ncbi:MAG: stage II sporulation protein R [Ruminococcus sp.]|jgi:stage II sporulation protein R|nr:stage II sporulation protein R [Ruminococcus sp.]
MKKLQIAMLIGFILSIIATDFQSFAKSYNEIQTNVLRMHILANSDSEKDQSVKLKVRDEILKILSDIFSDCENEKDAEKSAKSNLKEIENLANRVLEENGFSYKAQAEVVNMPFDERNYGNWTMPAGDYNAVRITLGEAAGQNWWCLMYPALCVPLAEGDDALDVDSSFDDGEKDILKNPKKYKFKFKIAEIFKSWFN